jgi:hypothetical protein
MLLDRESEHGPASGYKVAEHRCMLTSNREHPRSFS